jgi:hypothetical protein
MAEQNALLIRDSFTYQLVSPNVQHRFQDIIALKEFPMVTFDDLLTVWEYCFVTLP